MAEVIFWSCVFLVSYVYLGYPAILFLLSLIPKRGVTTSVTAPSDFVPSISVIIAACNEEAVIGRTVRHVLEQATSNVEIIVGSDGSTDRTVDEVRAIGDPRVRVFDFRERRGRARVHNDCVMAAKGEIVVFLDAETIIDRDFFAHITRPFSDSRVGCVVGQLRWRNIRETAISTSQGLYWRYELWLRQLESRLGLLATGTGACMAVRRELFKPLAPDEDVDFITPLDVVAQNYRVAYEPRAVATDVAPESVAGQIRARSRMTTKNLTGTLRKLRTMSPCQFPGIWWSVFSHKILRWLTPLFLTIAIVSNFFLLDRIAYRITLAVQVLACALAIVGYMADVRGKRLPLVSSVFGFLVANVGMFLGVIHALRGVRITAYERTG